MLALHTLHNGVEVIGAQPLSSQINHETPHSNLNQVVEMLKEAERAL